MKSLAAAWIPVLMTLAFARTATPQVPAPRAGAQTPAIPSADPHDLSGVWQLAPGGGGQGPGDNFPPLTP